MMNNIVTITEGFQYDEELYVEPGKYEYCECGINGYEMIKVNDIWIDIVEFPKQFEITLTSL